MIPQALAPVAPIQFRVGRARTHTSVSLNWSQLELTREIPSSAHLLLLASLRPFRKRFPIIDVTAPTFPRVVSLVSAYSTSLITQLAFAPCPYQVKLDATFRVIREFCDLRQLLFRGPRGFTHRTLIFVDSRLCVC